jgi:hypothetical protein
MSVFQCCIERVMMEPARQIAWSLAKVVWRWGSLSGVALRIRTSTPQLVDVSNGQHVSTHSKLAKALKLDLESGSCNRSYHDTICEIDRCIDLVYDMHLASR